MQLTIEKLVYGGEGLARLPSDERGPGKTVFVPFSLPSERVQAEIVEQKPGFARARLDSVVEPSPERRDPLCPYFLRCGGCHYQHANYTQQLKAKTEILLETLRRTAKLELPCELTVHTSPEWEYRNRVQLRVQTAPEFAIGYYKFRSHDLLPVEQCPISSPLINQAMTALWQAGRAGHVPKEIREVELFADGDDTGLLVAAYCEPRISRANAEAVATTLRRAMPGALGVAAFEQSAPNQITEPKTLTHAGATALQYQTRLASYRVSAGAFFQVNRFLVDELVQIVTEGLSGKLALDLYAGVGLFSTVLARSFAQVIAVESSQTSYSDLRHNSPREVKAALATTAQYLGQTSGLRPDLVVADPPRGGLGEDAIRSLARLDAPRIIYVSCDPSTLARDLRLLVSLGYKIDGAHLIDLFPQTYHIESVFHLAR